MGKIENICTFSVAKMWKICAFHIFLFKIHLKSFHIGWRICQELVLTVGSAVPSSKYAWFCSKNAHFCSKMFSKLMLEIPRRLLKIVSCSKCLKCSRSILLPLGLNSVWQSWFDKNNSFNLPAVPFNWAPGIIMQS